MSGFASPNYTQTPNDFFDMIAEMGDAELRATLVMIRQTFGFHREGFKLGINKLADAAGLSRNGAKEGAEQAEKRGTFRRTNPDAQTEAEWELVVGQPVTPSANDQGGSQPVTTPPSVDDPQVRVKESNKEINNNAAKFRKLGDKTLDRNRRLSVLLEKINLLLGIAVKQNNAKQWRAWSGVCDEILRREEKGQSFETYAKWFNSTSHYQRPKLHQIGFDPQRILDSWADAFRDTAKKEVEKIVEPDWMTEMQRRAERANV